MKSSMMPAPILIVDDRPENLMALQAVLSTPEYVLIEASSGAQALSYLETKDCAVILLDVQMPIMDGFETALRMRKNPKNKNIPIIFITASIEENIRLHQGYESGAIDYIFKPFIPEVLRSKVSFFVQLYRANIENKLQTDILFAQDEENVSSVLENALDAVVGMNADGNIIYWNSQATKIFGWQKKEALGSRMSEMIIPTEFRHLHEDGIAHFLKTGIGPILNKRIEVEAFNKNQEKFPVELTVTPLRRNGEYTFTAFVRDISERKKNEEDKKNEKILLEKALKTREEFISICSHELNTPVTALKLQFQMAKRQIENEDKDVLSIESATRRIEMVDRQLGRMGRLISDMLDVSRISSGKLEMTIQSVDLKKVIEEVIEMFQEQLESEGVRLNFKSSVKSAMMMGDQYRLEQVISNLIINAIKYGEGKPIYLDLTTLEGLILFSVQDKGMGIEVENQKKIFNMFERAVKPNHISGLGLGLFITKQIVDNHHGTIEVKSTIGSGSTFIVKLPHLM
jgi:PAS domain S-box-containing protein